MRNLKITVDTPFVHLFLQFIMHFLISLKFSSSMLFDACQVSLKVYEETNFYNGFLIFLKFLFLSLNSNDTHFANAFLLHRLFPMKLYSSEAITFLPLFFPLSANVLAFLYIPNDFFFVLYIIFNLSANLYLCPPPPPNLPTPYVFLSHTPSQMVWKSLVSLNEFI